MNQNICHSFSICQFVILFILLTKMAESRPSDIKSLWGWKIYSTGAMQAWKPVRNKFEIESGPENECSFKADVRDLCQRCAKVTRSRHVYPKCCNHNQKSIYQDRGVSLGVRDWCDNFLNFGIA